MWSDIGESPDYISLFTMRDEHFIVRISRAYDLYRSSFLRSRALYIALRNNIAATYYTTDCDVK